MAHRKQRNCENILTYSCQSAHKKGMVKQHNTHTPTHKHKHKQASRQDCRQASKQTNKNKNKQAHTHTHTRTRIRWIWASMWWSVNGVRHERQLKNAECWKHTSQNCWAGTWIERPQSISQQRWSIVVERRLHQCSPLPCWVLYNERASLEQRLTHTHTRRKTNKQTNEQTHEQPTNQPTNQTTNQPTKQASKQASKKQTNKQTW